MYRMIALFPGLYVGGHKPEMKLIMKTSHQRARVHVCVCVCVCVCVGCVYMCVRGEGKVFHITHSLASNTLQERGTATIELLPRKKLDLTNQIHTLRRLHPLSWSTIHHVFSGRQHLVT